MTAIRYTARVVDDETCATIRLGYGATEEEALKDAGYDFDEFRRLGWDCIVTRTTYEPTQLSCCGDHVFYID